ncbi:hypothetical protein ELG72_03910 [Rhizobium leguminosarum]|nr:hypothetical protein ELG82_04925 [Rhizobium leguminosarum]TBG19748.1 hypothetical protein ELG81_03920 [Rhizobium leguminosarum]TBG36229.1 hypothetical protein ELG78_04190 [Rhizobium leguminosarum]TBG45666.1 hypothetical protein ELG75_03920 [Rhizobium leguminosarum]TBG57580.1 hypothetical protein ELG71_04100 [Rhizobium leguminosarum]
MLLTTSRRGAAAFWFVPGGRPSSGCRHLTGVEPLVSTRPSDPRLRGEGDMPRPLRSPPTSRRARPLSPFLRGEG